MSQHKNVMNEDKHLIQESLHKTQRDIEMALIKPLNEEYQFSSNGIYFLIGTIVRLFSSFV